jgi:hypothetical protein
MIDGGRGGGVMTT